MTCVLCWLIYLKCIQIITDHCINLESMPSMQFNLLPYKIHCQYIELAWNCNHLCVSPKDIHILTIYTQSWLFRGESFLLSRFINSTITLLLTYYWFICLYIYIFVYLYINIQSRNFSKDSRKRLQMSLLLSVLHLLG